MRRRSAALELTLLTVFVMAALLAASSWVSLRWQRSWLLGEARRGLLLTCDALEGSLRHAMMQNRREEIRATIERITRQTQVRQIRLVEHRGRITISTRAQDLGGRLQTDAPPCALCHRSKGTRPVSPPGVAARTVLDANNLRAFTPILAEPGCVNQACHQQEKRSGVLGVIDISLPLDEVERNLAETRRWSLALSGISVLAGAVVVWLVLARRFRRPMQDLLRGIRRAAAGDLTHRIAVGSNDEFGELAHSFNAMAEQLAGSQQSLIQSERLISMGKLAAGVAHEINNPLTGIVSYAEALAEDAALSDPHRKDYEVILREALRCRKIVRGLLDFARQDAPALAPSHPKDLIERTLDVVARQATFRNIEVRKAHRAGSSPYRGGPSPDRAGAAQPHRQRSAGHADWGQDRPWRPAGCWRRSRGAIGPGRRYGHPARDPPAHLRTVLLHQARQDRRARPGCVPGNRPAAWGRHRSGKPAGARDSRPGDPPGRPGSHGGKGGR